MAAPHFSKETLAFLKKASRQKRPDWLDKNREEYEATLLRPLQNLGSTLKRELATRAPGYHFPLKGIGRIKRAAHRVENGGNLYKNWISYTASRPSGSRFDHNPSIFFMINLEDKDDTVLLAGGLYMPSSRQLRAIREAIAADASAFDALFASKDFAARFKGGFSQERMSSRPPRGFDKEHPRLPWLKLQGYYVWRSYSLREFGSPQFAELIARDAAQILRLNALLDQAIAGTLRAAPRKAKAPRLLERLDEVAAPRREMDF